MYNIYVVQLLKESIYSLLVKKKKNHKPFLIFSGTEAAKLGKIPINKFPLSCFLIRSLSCLNRLLSWREGKGWLFLDSYLLLVFSYLLLKNRNKHSIVKGTDKMKKGQWSLKLPSLGKLPSVRKTWNRLEIDADVCKLAAQALIKLPPMREEGVYKTFLVIQHQDGQ